MRTVSFNNQLKGIPSSFNELSLEQVRVYVREIEMRRHQLFVVEDGVTKVKDPEALVLAQCNLLFSLLGIPAKQFFQISQEQIRDLLVTSKLVEFYFNDHLTINPAQIVVSWRRPARYGPADSFHRMSFEEFGFADAACMNFNNTREEKYLDQLIAILYRPAKRKFNPKSADTDGDIREPFNNLTYSYREKEFSRMAMDFKMVIHLWFSHCRLNLLNHYAAVFKKHDDESSMEESNTWVDTAMTLGGGVLNFHTIRKEKVYLVFEEMKRLVTEREQLLEELEERRNGSD